ncbi:gas vesicle protein GvpO [Streptomyces sp. DSM 118878]
MANTTRKTTDSNTPDETANKPQTREEPEPKRKDTAQSKDDALPGPMVVLRGAREQLAELTGMTPESVSSFERTDNGWLLEVEVLELARVPDTMSLLASYEVQLDPQGELTGYRRLRRYERGRSEPRGAGR